MENIKATHTHPISINSRIRTVKIISLIEIIVFVVTFSSFLNAATKTYEGSYAAKTVLFIINYIQQSAALEAGNLIALDNMFNLYNGFEPLRLTTDIIFNKYFQRDLNSLKQAEYMSIPNYFATDYKFAIIIKGTPTSKCVSQKISLFNQNELVICDYSNISSSCSADTCNVYLSYLDDTYADYSNQIHSLFTITNADTVKLSSLTNVEIVLLLNNIAINSTFDIHINYDISNSGLVTPSYSSHYINNNNSSPFIESWKFYLACSLLFIAVHVASIVIAKAYEANLIEQGSREISNTSRKKITRWGLANMIATNKWTAVMTVYLISSIMALYWYLHLLDELSKPVSQKIGVATNAYSYLNYASINISFGGVILVIESMRYLPYVFNTGSTLKVFKDVGNILSEYSIFLLVSLLAFTFASYFYYGFAAFQFNTFFKSFQGWFSILFSQTSSYSVMVDYNITFGLIFFVLFVFFNFFIIANVCTVIIMQSVQNCQKKYDMMYNHIYWAKKIIIKINESFAPQIDTKTLLNGNDFIDSLVLKNVKRNRKYLDIEKGENKPEKHTQENDNDNAQSHKTEWQKYLEEYKHYKSNIKINYSINEELRILKSNDPFTTTELKGKMKFQIKRKSCMSNWKSISYVLLVILSYILFFSIENFNEDDLATKIYQCISNSFNPTTGYLGSNFDNFVSFNEMYNWAYNFEALFGHVAATNSYYFPNGYELVKNRVLIKFKKGRKATLNRKTVFLAYTTSIDEYKIDENEDITLPELDGRVNITNFTADSKFYFMVDTTIDKMSYTVEYLINNKIAADQLWYFEVSFNLISSISQDTAIVSNSSVAFKTGLNSGNMEYDIQTRVKYLNVKSEYHPLSLVVCMTLLLVCTIGNNYFLVKFILYKNNGYKQWVKEKNFSKQVKEFRDWYCPEIVRRIKYVFDIFTCIEVVYTLLQYIIIASLYGMQLIFYNKCSALNAEYDIPTILEIVYNLRDSFMFHETLLSVLYIVGAVGSLRILNATQAFKIIIESIYSSFVTVLSQFVTLILIIVGCWGVCVLCLGSYTLKFSNFQTSLATLFSYINGNFQFEELDKSNSVISMIFIVMFMLISKLYIYNVITAIFTISLQNKIISSKKKTIKEPNFFKALFLRKTYKPAKNKSNAEKYKIIETVKAESGRDINKLFKLNLKTLTNSTHAQICREDKDKIIRALKESETNIKDSYEMHKKGNAKEAYKKYQRLKSERHETIRNLIKLYHFQTSNTIYHTREVMKKVFEVKSQIDSTKGNNSIAIKMIEVIK